MMQTFWAVGSKQEEMEKTGYPGLLPGYPVSMIQNEENFRQDNIQFIPIDTSIACSMVK